MTREIETWLRIVGSIAIAWLTTEADDQSCLPCVIVSKSREITQELGKLTD